MAPIPPTPMAPGSRETAAEEWLQGPEFAALFAPRKRRRGPSGCLWAGLIAAVVAIALLVLLAILVSSAQSRVPSGAIASSTQSLSQGCSTITGSCQVAAT